MSPISLDFKDSVSIDTGFTNKNSDEDVRLSESDCEESADVIDNNLGNPDMYVSGDGTDWILYNINGRKEREIGLYDFPFSDYHDLAAVKTTDNVLVMKKSEEKSDVLHFMRFILLFSRRLDRELEMGNENWKPDEDVDTTPLFSPSVARGELKLQWYRKAKALLQRHAHYDHRRILFTPTRKYRTLKNLSSHQNHHVYARIAQKAREENEELHRVKRLAVQPS
ncbi:hypothetical protein TNCV_3827311 [Trichonephila clavipes]|nr:hypothetical protein TNCV_3827311 [Trichonephila clavipes]